MYLVHGIKLISGIAIQTPTFVGPFVNLSEAERVENEMWDAGYLDVEIFDLLTEFEWKKEAGLD